MGADYILRPWKTGPDRHLVCELHPPQKKGTWLQVASIQWAFRVPQVVSLGVHSDSDSQQTLPLASATCPCNSTVSPRQLPGLALGLFCALNHLGNFPMVRLVFRPYTQVRKAICTSAHLRASTWVSPSFALLRHSSPSFGSQHTYSNSILSQKLMVGRECGLRPGPHQFLCASWVCSPPARTHVALLGPCFKTGASEAFRRHHGDAVPEGLGRPDTSARLATA